MRIFCAAAVIAFLATILAAPFAGPARAQEDHVLRYHEKEPDKTPRQIEADKAAERAYQRSLGNVPDKAAADPWGSERSLTESKGDSKAAPKATSKATSSTKSATKTATKSAAKPAPVKPQASGSDTD